MSTSPLLRACFPICAVLVPLLGLSACGDDEVKKKEWPASPGSVTVTAAERGLPLEMNRSHSANRVKYDTHEAEASAVFVYEQIYSEYVDATGSGRPEFDDRIDSIYEPLPVNGSCDESGGCFGNELALYENHYLVYDLQRRDREWLVDWEGLSRDEEPNRDSMTFARRDDYWVDAQDRLVSAVQRAAPEAVIIGMEMNRYYAQNASDWANFIEFYWALYDAVKAADPSVRVGPGFNWSYLMESNVASFVQENEAVTDVEPFERAYAAIVAPVVTRPDGASSSDFVGLSAVPDPAVYDSLPANVPDQHFAGLRLVLPEGTVPVVWFQVGWPVRNAGSSAPADWYARFLELSGGPVLERVSWWGLTNLLPGDCVPLTGDEVGASDEVCFRGLFSDSGAATALSDAYFSDE